MMNETPGDYLTDYGTVVYVKSVEVVGDYIYHNGRYNFEANSTVKITYHLENPNQFELYDGTSVAPGETPLVTSAFPAGSDLETNPPALNYDAEFQTITLTYGASGADHDAVKGNVSPTIWIYRADGRPQSAYTLPIFCDTPEKLDPPTFTWTQPQATGKDYGTLEISCAAAPYATINYTVTNASGDVVASGSHNGTTVLNLYPEKIGGVGIQYSAEATASFGGCYPSDAATGNETIEGTKLTTPTSNSNDATAGWVSQVNNIEERDYAEYILTAEEGATIEYIIASSVSGSTPITGSGTSPVRFNLSIGTYAVTATAKKPYHKNSDPFIEPGASGITVKSNVVYVSASGSDTTGNGSKTKPYATLSKAASNKTEDISVIFLTDMLITNDTDMNITGSTGKTTLRPSGSSRITIYCDDESGASFDVRGTIEVNNINFARSAGSTSTKPAINVGSGSLTLNNVTINGITSDQGAVVASGNSFVVKDNVVITNNKNTSGKPCNVNLGGSGFLGVGSALSGTKVGVTVAESRAPSVSPSGGITQFTSGYGSNCNSTTPKNYFTSDQGYAVIYNEDINTPNWSQAALSYTGGSGTIVVNAPPSITFELEDTTTAGITTVTIKAKQNVGGTMQDVTAKMGSWNCTVLFGGMNTGIPATGNSITFPAEVDSATFNITFSCVYNDASSPYNGFACGGGLLYMYTKP